MEHGELRRLLDSMIHRAKLSREKAGIVAPFGMTLSDEGKISLLASGTRAQQNLEEGLCLLAQHGNCKALGICSSDSSQNVNVFVEHRDGSAFRIRLSLVGDFLRNLQSTQLKPLRAEPKFFVRSNRNLLGGSSMRSLRLVPLVLVLLLCLPAWAQQPKQSAQGQIQPAQSDPKAVAALSRSLALAGGTRGIASIQDFTASGTINYFWSSPPTSVPATVRGHIPDQFRLDANLPEGQQSYSVTTNGGKAKGAMGKISKLPLHSTANVGIPTFPYLTLQAALNDSFAVASYVGVTEVNGSQAQEIRIQRHLPPRIDPVGISYQLMITHYFVDQQSGLLVKVSRTGRSIDDLRKTALEEIELQSYATTDGIAVPMLVRQKTNGQTDWEFHLNSISFNTGLHDSDFLIQ